MINFKKLAASVAVVIAFCLAIATPVALFALSVKYLGGWAFALLAFFAATAWVYVTANEGELEALFTRKKKK